VPSASPPASPSITRARPMAWRGMPRPMLTAARHRRPTSRLRVSRSRSRLLRARLRVTPSWSIGRPTPRSSRGRYPAFPGVLPADPGRAGRRSPGQHDLREDAAGAISKRPDPTSSAGPRCGHCRRRHPRHVQGQWRPQWGHAERLRKRPLRSGHPHRHSGHFFGPLRNRRFEFASRRDGRHGGAVWWHDGSGFHQVTDADLPVTSSFAFYAGRWYFAKNGTGTFYWSALDDISTIDGLAFSDTEASPDKIVRIAVLGDDLVFFGANSVEFWYSSGDANQPVQRYTNRTFS